ncbi:hypothetical protein AYI70_g7905 [Smittium culicis]|uniref:Uncharacterized protein n=1 Tax=Smittium culicis TaxID=133412 RepID=A0A1R1XIB7_9FUNG|nr:hypothetical protein AYI70_g7905 [Smittium culicis]
MSFISLGAFHAVGITNFTPYYSSAGLNPVPADFIVLMTRSVSIGMSPILLYFYYTALLTHFLMFGLGVLPSRYSVVCMLFLVYVLAVTTRKTV